MSIGYNLLMNIYALLEHAISTDKIALKEELTLQCLAYCNQNEVSTGDTFVPVRFTSPSYASRCTIVDPRKLPARKDFDTNEGLATLIHAIAHIEYSAIDLALDAVYRFPEMPLEYKIDWLEVAHDEIRHFGMLNALLESVGFEYGDFPVHCGLFDAADHTADSVLDRMAIVPRYYEASGLDVNPQIIKKLENKRKNPVVATLMDALNLIYEEEIEHVHKGDKWFKYLCEQNGLDESVYFDILERYKLLGKHRPHINVNARKEAGFTCDEIMKLGAKQCQ
ncbi:ferritin-like domain-containing protein [Sulfurovum sp.]|uniref:ferritin-like domain-containing protein n=1 Tax=Sulfurovum sp. TaxID=1969726 RepID=UPI0025F45F25|nr:ferritin-like domain-containing protein [Sulfurovum sp.]